MEPETACALHDRSAYVHVSLFLQLGSFVGPKTVRVEGVDYSADHILIAVGGQPSLPVFEGVEHCISSDGFFKLEVGECRTQSQSALLSEAGCSHYLVSTLAGYVALSDHARACLHFELTRRTLFCDRKMN